MLYQNDYYGSSVAIVTPMYPDGRVDYETLEKLIEFHIDSNTSTIVSVGTTGESATLSHKEHHEVLDFTIKNVNGRIPVIAGTGSNSTQEAIELTAYAKTAGAKACLIVVPYYNKPTQEGMYRHFKAIAEAVDTSIFLYNVPARTGCDMLPETVVRLSKITNIIGVKEATGDLSRVAKIKSAMADGFILLSGDDHTASKFILLGGVGNISVAANIVPKQMAEIYSKALAGKKNEVEEMENPFFELYDALGSETNPQPIKWAMAKVGLINSGQRLPLIEFDQKYHRQMERVLKIIGLL